MRPGQRDTRAFERVERHQVPPLRVEQAGQKTFRVCVVGIYRWRQRSAGLRNEPRFLRRLLWWWSSPSLALAERAQNAGGGNLGQVAGGPIGLMLADFLESASSSSDREDLGANGARASNIQGGIADDQDLMPL